MGAWIKFLDVLFLSLTSEVNFINHLNLGYVVYMSSYSSIMLVFLFIGFYQRDSLAFLSHRSRVELGRYLVLGINFFRELICSFIQEDDKVLCIKIWYRLQNVLELQKY